MRIKIALEGTSPLLMHNPRLVDPEYSVTREIKKLTGKRKKTDEDLKQIAKLEWYGGLYEEDGVIVQPTSKVRKCMICTARMNKLGKAGPDWTRRSSVERGVAVYRGRRGLAVTRPAMGELVRQQPRPRLHAFLDGREVFN